jgi:hypothetical protein
MVFELDSPKVRLVGLFEAAELSGRGMDLGSRSFTPERPVIG